MSNQKDIREAKVIVRLFAEEKAALKLAAGAHGLSMSEYVRQMCLNLRLRQTPTEKTLLYEMARIRHQLCHLAGLVKANCEEEASKRIIHSMNVFGVQLDNAVKLVRSARLEE